MQELLLDRYRIGLSVGQLFTLTEPTSLRAGAEPVATPIAADGRTFRPGDFVLGITSEKIALSGNLCGSLHTRSKYARRGLKMLGSSDYVAPGSGVPIPISLVLEIEFAATVVDFELGMPYAFMLVYDLGQSASDAPTPTNFHDRFPLPLAGD